MKKRYIMLSILVFVLVALLLFLRFGGEILVAQDELEDMEPAPIVLLMGSVGDRALGAYELYEKGLADGIYMVESHVAGSDLLEERKISVPGDAELSKEILIELGVPEEEITILSGDAESTKDEALAVRDYFRNQPEIENVIVTTSKFHSWRSRLIFSKALEDMDINVYSVPTPYDKYQARGWYQDREDIQRVITEYIKLGNHFLIEQFQLS